MTLKWVKMTNEAIGLLDGMIRHLNEMISTVNASLDRVTGAVESLIAEQEKTSKRLDALDKGGQ